MKLNKYFAAPLAAAGLFFCLNGAAVAQKGVNADTPPSAISTDSGQTRGDVRFAREAAEGGMLEVELGKLAVQKATNEKVKEFGQRMIDDHSRADDQLRSIAAKDNIKLPTELDSRNRATVDRFSRMTGTEFDRVYARDMARDHQNDVTAFEREANSGFNPDLKNFANSTLPTLRDHLRLAKDNERAMGITSSRRNPNNYESK